MRHLTPKEIAQALTYYYLLADEPGLRIPQRIGRQPRRAADTQKLVERLDKRIKRTGERPTTAARGLFPGLQGQALKDRADHLVRAWKKRGLKSP